MSEVTEGLARVTAALPGGGEARPGQVQMAEAVAKAVEDRRHLIVQAGTGTGKSLAYLVPTVLAGQKTVIATATKALQDQLAGRELPHLKANLGLPFEFAVLKGRANYLCRQRAREVAGGDDQLDLEDAGTDKEGGLAQEIRRLLAWGQETLTGDRSELAFEPNPKAWSAVSVSAMECPGAANCPSGDDCLAEAAKQRAELADVVVVNTHLYGTHLASGGYVLPAHDVVVFDEAHEVEDVASNSLGLELGAGRFRAFARNARRLVEDGELLDAVADSGDRLDTVLEPLRDKRLPVGLGAELSDVLALAADRVSRATAAIRRSSNDADTGRRARALQAAGHLAGDIAMLTSLPETHVAWVEGPAYSPVLKVAPVDVGATLAAALWDQDEVTAILTSATIPPLLSVKLGLPEGKLEELDVGSPFDYEHNGLLYCAAHLPDPRRPEYEPAMHEELEALIKAAGGRTLALFTSWRAMTAAAEAVGPRLPYKVWTQSDLPKPALVKEFTEEESSCLFATMGFWQGVDVPGESLSMVTIDRVPFARPDEPLLQARRERAGASAFRVVDLPRAATLLAQGTGRLIRNTTDRGVVAVLDPRLASATYRWELVHALPPMRRTRHLADVEAFFSAGPGSAPDTPASSPPPAG
jgi:ATP-dependent DNA helicase DinG